jgi:hypothetical protein
MQHTQHKTWIKITFINEKLFFIIIMICITD